MWRKIHLVLQLLLKLVEVEVVEEEEVVVEVDAVVVEHCPEPEPECLEISSLIPSVVSLFLFWSVPAQPSVWRLHSQPSVASE